MNSYLRKEMPLQRRMANAAKGRYSDFRCTFKDFDTLAGILLKDYFAYSQDHYENLTEYFDLTPNLTYGDLANMIYRMRKNIDNKASVLSSEDCIANEEDFRTVMYNFIEPFNESYDYCTKASKDILHTAALNGLGLGDDSKNMLTRWNEKTDEKTQNYITKIPLAERTKLIKKENITLFGIARITLYNYFHGISEYTKNPHYKSISPLIDSLDTNTESLIHYIHYMTNRYDQISDEAFTVSMYEHLFILLVIPFSNK